MIFVNFKTYKEGTGSRAVDLVQHIVRAQKDSGVPIIPVVQVVDARLCVNTSGYSVWVQHLDFQEAGRSTGWSIPEAIAETGVVGAFLNHSEHKYADFADLKKVADRCRSMGIETLIFAKDLEELREVVKLKSSYVAFEPPELIASKESSVASARPDLISEAAKICKEARLQLIVGAGIKSKQDVEVSLKIGAMGVAVSSAVVLSEDPYKVLMDLAGGVG